MPCTEACRQGGGPSDIRPQHLDIREYNARDMDQRIDFTTSSDGWRLAWSAMGSGPPILYLLQGHHLTRSMDNPRYARAIRRAAERHTVLRFDFRGTGLSQREIPRLTQSVMCDDILAVLDASGHKEVSVVTTGNTCLWAVPFAIAHPERVISLVLDSPMPRWELAPALREMLEELAERDWLGYWETVVALQVDLGPDEVRTAARICAESMDKRDYAVLRDAWHASPIDRVLPQCTVRTLVVRHEGRRINVGEDPAADVAALLPNASVLAIEPVPLTIAAEWLTSDPVLEFIDAGGRCGADPQAEVELTRREREVLALVALGRTDPEIAEALTISPKTASRHVHNILGKLNMHRRSEAAAWWGRASATTNQAVE